MLTALFILVAVLICGWLISYFRYLASGEYATDKRLWDVTWRR